MSQGKLFDPDNRKKIYNKLISQNQNKFVPVVLFFHNQKTWKGFKQYLIVAIDPQYSVHQLIQMLQVKLVWRGYLTEQNKAIFVSVGDMQITAAFDKKVKTLYDKYRKEDGWLELSVTTLSSFG